VSDSGVNPFFARARKAHENRAKRGAARARRKIAATALRWGLAKVRGMPSATSWQWQHQPVRLHSLPDRRRRARWAHAAAPDPREKSRCFLPKTDAERRLRAVAAGMRA